MVDTAMLKKIKVIQMNEIKNWKGLQIEYIARPGKALQYQYKIGIQNLSSSKKYQKTYEYFKLLREGPLPLSSYSKTSMIGAVSVTGGFLEQSHHDLLYKLVKTDGKLLRSVLENNGFLQTEAHDWNILWSCQSLKLNQYEGLNENQRINHFPQSYELTRKDRLCYNVVQMQEKFGKEEFNIIPDTYILPDEFADFYSHFHKLKSKEQSNFWIIKPQNSSQGKGIYIIDDISEVPIDEQCIVSKYITNPLLINGLKFDMRIYVLITSIDPWRVYIYNEGLARFASETYAPQTSKQNKFAHLTNYSINKKNEKYVPNMNAEQDDTGHKWSLAALSKHLEQMGIDLNLMWAKIYDVIIKSLLTADSAIYANLKKLPNKNNCFEVLGYDILIDHDLKPWIMEINLSPSLATDSPLDVKIKSGLVVDTFNIIGVKKFDRRRDNLNKMKNRVKNIMRAKSYQSRQNNQQSNAQTKNMFAGRHLSINVIGSGKNDEINENDFFYKNKLLFERISQVNGRHRDMIRETLSEHARKNNFIRIFPSKNSDIYDQYFVTPRPSNKFLYRYLFCDEIIHFPAGYPALSQNMLNKQQSDNQQDQNSDYTNQQDKQLASTGFPQTFQSNQIQNGDLNKFSTGSRMNSAIQKNRVDNLSFKKLSQSQATGSVIIQQQEIQQQLQKEKLLITGDDVLIEYVSRLMIAVKSIKEHILRPAWKNQVEKFIKHYVWHSSDVRRAENNMLWQRLESRLIEMKERRKRLLKSMYKKENPQNLNILAGQAKQQALNHVGIIDFEKEYDLKEGQKNVIIQGFSAAQLEEMLRTSTKNVAYEVISCLIDSQGKGVLTEIIKWLTTCNQNLVNDQESILNQLSRKHDVDESEEEPESFIYAPVGSGTTKGGDNNSTTSIGSGSIGSGNSGDIRIKIRKNSMEPHSKMKANHSQLIQQKLKQQEQQQQQQQVQDNLLYDTKKKSIIGDKGYLQSISPIPHQKTHSSLIAGSKIETPSNEMTKGISRTIIKNISSTKEEIKEFPVSSLYGSPIDKTNRSFQGMKNEDFSSGSTKFNLQKLQSPDGEYQKLTKIETDRKQSVQNQDSQSIQLNCALSKIGGTSKALIEPFSSDSLPSKSTTQSNNATSMIEKNVHSSTSSCFKTYSSQLKNEIFQQQSSNIASVLINPISSDQITQPSISQSNNLITGTSSQVYGNYLTNQQVTSTTQNNFSQQMSASQNPQTTVKKTVKVQGQRKTYSSVKRGGNATNTGGVSEMIGEMKKNSVSKTSKNAK